MGKKNIRGNRGVSRKQKSTRRGLEDGSNDTSAASDVAAVGETEASTTRTSTFIKRDFIDSFFELLKKEDYEGALNLEPDVVRQAKGLEGTEPEMASMIYQAIATAHLEIGSPSRKMAPEKAIRYLERSFGLLEKINDTQEGIHSCVLLLVSVHLQEGRYNEAVGTVKRLTFSMNHISRLDSTHSAYFFRSLSV